MAYYFPLSLFLTFFIVIQPVESLPEGFVFVKEIYPSIIENIRYNTNENFMGKRMIGYSENASIILTVEAATALKPVVTKLESDGYALVFYDAYRARKTVDRFWYWAQDLNDNSTKTKYYPYVEKQDLFPKVLLANLSGHSRGSTMDITIIKLGGKTLTSVKPIKPTARQLTDGRKILYLDDGTVDMGSSWDLLDDASSHGTTLINSTHLQMRNYLKELMNKAGFTGYPKEWWHYSLNDEPFPEKYFNFDVESNIQHSKGARLNVEQMIPVLAMFSLYVLII